MRKLNMRLLVFALGAMVLCGALPAARAVAIDNEPITWAGWEDWSPTLYQFSANTVPNARFLCPKSNASDEEIYYYLGKLIAENLDSGYRLTLRFPQPNWSDAEGNAWCQAQDHFVRWKKWYFGNAYIQTDAWFSGGVLHVSAESAPEADMEVVVKVAEIGEAAKAASDTARGQLDYVNRYLSRTIVYDNSNNDTKNTARAALITGRAACGGFSEATAAICDYLRIPNVEVQSATHGWNSVYVDGAWKHLDVTWDTPFPDSWGDPILVEQVTYQCFLIDKFTDNSTHAYDADKLAAQQAAILKGWDALTAPLRSLDAVDYFSEHGVLRGDQNGTLNLNAGLTRAELATILTRLGGAEDAVMAEKDRYAAICIFTDVPDWAKPYVGYCAEQGLVQGYNAATFGSADAVTPAAACTVILRHKGYAETDWNYNTAIGKAASVGLVSPYWPTGDTALRMDMALLASAAMQP